MLAKRSLDSVRLTKYQTESLSLHLTRSSGSRGETERYFKSSLNRAVTFVAWEGRFHHPPFPVLVSKYQQSLVPHVASGLLNEGAEGICVPVWNVA